MKFSHNDNPALDDAFGHDAFLAEVCKQISTCTPPKGIGINGYWQQFPLCPVARQ